MNYKQKKYYRQNLDFNMAMSNTNLFLVFQFKTIDVLKWVFLKRILLKYNLKSKIFFIKSFKKNNFFSLKSNILKNIYNGQILIIYSKQKLLCYLIIKKVFNFLKNIEFLIPIHIFFYKRFFSFNRFEALMEICLKDSKTELIHLILHLKQFIFFFDKILYSYVYNLKRII